MLGAGIGAFVRNTGGAVTGTILLLVILPPLAVQLASEIATWVPGTLANVVSGVTNAAGMGAAIAAKVRQPDMVGMLSMFWLFPLMLASTAFAPAETMPGWLQPFVTYQPISAASDAVRGLANGTPAGGDILLSLGWTALLLAVFGPMSVRLYQKES